MVTNPCKPPRHVARPPAPTAALFAALLLATGAWAPARAACHVTCPPGLLPAATWQRPAVKSASNCAACHTRADQGDFDEHTVRIPR